MTATKTVTATYGLFYDTDKDCDALGWSRWHLVRGATRSNYGNCVFVREVDLSFEIPADFDPRPEQVKALQAKKRELQAEFAAAVTQIERRINELQAISMDPIPVPEVTDFGQFCAATGFAA